MTAGSFAVATGASATDGTFSMPGVPSNAGSIVVLAAATVNGCGAQGTSTPPVPPVAGGTTLVGVVTLNSTALTTVAGLVLDTNGLPVVGATVVVSSADLADLATVTSGPGGTFAAAGFPARQWSLSGFAAGTVGGAAMSGRSLAAAATPGGRTDLGVVQLAPLPVAGPDPGTTVTGLVVGQDGVTPAAGVQVVVDAGPYGLLVTTTGGDGRFSLPGVPTLGGSAAVAASRRDGCVLLNTGTPLAVPTLSPGGVTDVGTLTLAPDSGPGSGFFS